MVEEISRQELCLQVADLQLARVLKQGIRVEAAVGPTLDEKSLLVVRDHLTEFIGENSKVFDRLGYIEMPVGPEFTLGDLMFINGALGRSRALGRQWTAHMYSVCDYGTVERRAIVIRPVFAHVH